MRGKSTVQVMPRGVSIHGKCLRISFQYCGKRCRESLGLHPTKTNIKFAENKLASIKYEIKIGAFSYAAHFPNSSSLINFDSRSNRSAVRIIDVLDEYKPLKFSDLKNATLRRYNVAYDKCLSILGSERLISAIYPEDISRLRANLINNLSASTCNHYMTVFRDFLKFIQQNGYTTKNLSNELRQVKTHRKDPDPLSLEEYNRVISSCCNEVHKNIITIMVYTGLRPGELAALSWRDIDFNRKEMTISRALSDRIFKLPKTNKPRTIILSPPAIEALKCQQKHTAMLQDIDVIIYCTKKEKRHEKIRPVFAPSTTASSDNHGKFFMASSLLNLWEKAVRRSGIRYRPIYQLRHTFACWNLTAHGNVAFIAKQMGHADYTMLVNVYGRWMDSESHTENDKIWESLAAKGHQEVLKWSQKCPKKIG